MDIVENDKRLGGTIHPRFEEVAHCFAKQLGCGGGALTVYHRNDPVVDIWAGVRNDEGDLWQEETLALVFSVTKGIVSTLMHCLVSEGLCHYEDRVCQFWPEFARKGKASITIRHLLCHEAGLYHIREMIEHAQFMIHWRYMVEALEEAEPIHAPGETHGYHALTYGWLLGELMQRITGRRLNELLQIYLVDPLNLDGLHIGSPVEAIARRAELVNACNLPLRQGRFPRLKLTSMKLCGQAFTGWAQSLGRHSIASQYHYQDTLRSLGPVGIESIDFNAHSLLTASIPAANALATSRSIAVIYAMLANQGRWQGHQVISPEVLSEATQIQNRTTGRVIPVPLQWRLGYHRVFAWPYRVDGAFGHLGFGGSGAWCDPDRELAVALIFNNGLGTPVGDMRLVRVNHAILRVIDRLT